VLGVARWRFAMSDDEVVLSMSLPLDSDGFLRRECPTCERELKWLASGDDEEDDEDGGAEVPDGGYFCPYCGIQAPPETWLTQAQVELAENLVATQVVGPMMKDFASGLGRSSGGLISVSATYDEPDAMEPLTEADDMTRVDFTCHPGEPVKVLDDWAGKVLCPMCGEPAT
jgi:hypothetical protein